MKLRVAALAALVLLPGLGLLPSVQAFEVEGATWGAPGASVEAAPGDTGVPLFILIRNGGPTTYSGVSATIAPARSEGASHLLPSSAGGVASLAGTFAPGDVWTARFTIDVMPEASPFIRYEIPVTLDLYDRTNATFVNAQVVAPIQLTGRANLILSLDPATLVAGAQTTLRLTVRNAGTGLAGDVRVTPAATSSLGLLSGEAAQPLGRLMPGEQRSAVILVKAATPGLATLAYGLAYFDAGGTSVQLARQRTLDVRAAPDASDDDALAARLTERQVDAGGLSNLTFLVWNNGTGTLRALQAEIGVTGDLVVPDASDRQLLADLPAGGQTRIVTNVMTNNDARGLQRVPLTLRWTRDDSTTGSRTFNLALPVVGRVDARVTGLTATVNNQTLAAAITGTITNVGNTPALGASIQLIGSPGFRAVDAQFLGDLSVNTAVPFTIPTTLLSRALLAPFANASREPGGPAAQSPNDVRLLLAWTDEYGEARSEVYDARVVMRPSASARALSNPASGEGESRIPSVATAAVLGSVVLLALAMRGRKEGKP